MLKRLLNKNYIIPLILLIVSGFVFFRNINSFPLKNWDEAWYAEVTKNMALKGTNLMMPYWNGSYFFDKPPLYFWLSMPFFRVFGAGEWQARIISVLASIGVVLMTYLIGKKIFNWRVGLMGSLILLLSNEVLLRFPFGNLDALMILTFLISFYIFVDSHDEKVDLVLSGVFLGLSVLSKGWIFGIFFVGIIILYSLLFRRKSLKTIYILLLSALASSGWWYLFGAIKFGQNFITNYLLDPLAGNITWKIPFFSVDLFISLFKDILLAAVPTLIIFFLYYKKHKSFRNYLIFIILISVPYILALSFFADKFSWYLLPLYPFLAIFAGWGSSILIDRKLLIFLLFIFLLAYIQIHNYKNIYDSDLDLSTKDKKLAIAIGAKIPTGSTVVLDYQNYPSFIFYAGLDRVLITSPNGGKRNEYWMIKNTDLGKVVASNEKVWLLTKEPKTFDKYCKGGVGEKTLYNYYLITCFGTL